MKNPERKMTIGIVGAGAVTRDLHLPVLVNMPNVELSWVCDKDESRARRLAKLYGISDTFDNVEECGDVDIVLIAIPVGYRQPVMEEVITRGWHIFCEKPFAVSLEQHDRYIAEANRNQVQVGIGLVRRYSPATLMARKIIDEGLFGPILEVWASDGMRTKRTGQGPGWYMGDPKIVGGGVLMETGSHLVDQLCTILSVTGFRIDRCIQRLHNGLEFETKFVGALSLARGESINCSFEVTRLEDLCNGVFIRFSDFLLKCGLYFEEPLELLRLSGEPIVRLETNEGARTIGQAFFLEWKDFIDQCTTGNRSIVSGESARYSTSLIEECYKNAELVSVGHDRTEVL